MFYKEKGFYISLLCGVVALIAFGVICYSMIGPAEEEDGNSKVAVESTKPVQTAMPKSEEANSKDVTSEVKPTSTPKAKEETKKTVKTGSNSVQNKLHFDQEAGLLWPVEGKILMEYSADKVVYFKTLAEYRTNPAILIAAKEGDNVQASANGVVTDIYTSEETGRTLTMDIGDDFTVSYGQLKEITVQKGDSVMEGQVIGKVAEPTKYYSMEGANLYYQVKENKNSVNPMVLLR